MRQNAKTRAAALRKLRRVIESTGDPLVGRIAYGMEYALRWSTFETVGWHTPAREAEILADLLRAEIRREIKST